MSNFELFYGNMKIRKGQSVQVCEEWREKGKNVGYYILYER